MHVSHRVMYASYIHTYIHQYIRAGKPPWCVYRRIPTWRYERGGKACVRRWHILWRRLEGSLLNFFTWFNTHMLICMYFFLHCFIHACLYVFRWGLLCRWLGGSPFDILHACMYVLRVCRWDVTCLLLEGAVLNIRMCVCWYVCVWKRKKGHNMLTILCVHVYMCIHVNVFKQNISSKQLKISM